MTYRFNGGFDPPAIVNANRQTFSKHFSLRAEPTDCARHAAQLRHACALIRTRRTYLSTQPTSIDLEPIRGVFRQWRAEQEPLAAQVSESLNALSAYQSHLDAWQQQLARERDELHGKRDEWAREQAATGVDYESRLAELKSELTAARERVDSLSTALLSRTDELRTLDNRRAEVNTELELTRAREKDLRSDLEQCRKELEQERSQWSEELRELQELLEQQANAAAQAIECAPAAAVAGISNADSGPRYEQADATATSNADAAVTAIPPSPSETPPTSQSQQGSSNAGDEQAVFGSVLQQFGKLRQQRAERPALHKAR